MSLRDVQADLLADTLGKALRRQALHPSAELEARPPLWRYQGRPLDFAREVLGLETRTGNVSLWAAQRAILTSIDRNHRTLVRACRKAGKSFAFAAAAHYWLQAGPGKVVVLGPGLDQVRDVFWAAFERLWVNARVPLLGEPGKLRAEIAPGRSIVAIPTKASPGRARGYHGDIRVPDDPDDLRPEAIDELEAATAAGTSPASGGGDGTRLLVLIDEGQEITPDVYRILQGTLSSRNVHVAIATNPLLGMSDSHEVAFAANEGSGYHRIAVSHVSEERILQLGGVRDPLEAEERFEAVPPYFVDDPEWLPRMLSRHDVSDPLLWSDVFGRLSEGNLSSLVLPRTALEAALERNPEDEGLPAFEGPSIGVDIGLTRDRCVAVLLLDGEMVDVHDWLPGAQDQQAQVSIAEVVEELAATWGHALHLARPADWDDVPIPGHRIHIDDSGMTAVSDILASRGTVVDRVDFGGGARGDWPEYVGDVEFVNRKAELFWCLRRLLQEGAVRVPRRFGKIWEQAQWLEFEQKVRAKGHVIQIQSKDEVRKLHGRSPDDLDALALAACEPSGTGRTFLGASGASRARTFG